MKLPNNPRAPSPPPISELSYLPPLKVIWKFFLKHNKSFRWHLGDYENIIFFHLKACERRNFDFCVFLRMCWGSV